MAGEKPVGNWFRSTTASGRAPRRLFLFPHGGGAAAAYSHWRRLIPEDIELLIVQLPGRHDRHGEQAFTRIEPLIMALSDVFAAELDDRPFGLFGHSMGAMLAYRLTVALESEGEAGPALLGVSAWAPGGNRPGAAALGTASDTELLAAVEQMGALPQVIRQDQEMLRHVLPTLRADTALYGDYVDDGVAVTCPVAAYGGVSDPLLLPGSMSYWRQRTPQFLGARQYPGEHFYLDSHDVAVAADLVRHLRRLSQPD